jgi:hypothetical protein
VSRKSARTSSKNDTISVIYPSPVPPHRPLDDEVTRAEFLARMDGTGAAAQVRATERVGVVALMIPEEVIAWMASRPGGIAGLLRQERERGARDGTP